MLPRWHILYGLIFTLIIWFFAPNITLFNLSLIFLSSVFIDIDHYLTAINRNKSLNLRKAFSYHFNKREEFLKNKNPQEKEDFHLFHTVEFIILIGIFGIFSTPFFYIFLGMVFHSLLDIVYMLYHGLFFAREFFLFNWTRKVIFK